MEEFKYTSSVFTTQVSMEKEKKILHQKLCDFIGVKRSEFRLQRGLITLMVKMNNQWIPYTGTITDFKQVMKDHKGSEVKLTIAAEINR